MKFKRTLSFVFALIIIMSLSAGCSSAEKDNHNLQTSSSIGQIIEAVYPENNAIVNLHTKKQDSYFSKSKLLNINVTGRKELSKPESVELQWVYNGEAVNEYTVLISEEADMSSPVTYTTSSESLVITNLKIAEEYYWTVSAGEYISPVSQFTTSSRPPRNIDVDGVKNVRDLGGRLTVNGTRTKQGLIYRCGRLNESSAASVVIEVTDSGRKTMLDDLKIKSEIDLRKVYDNEVGSISSSPLGESVTYYSCPMEWEGDVFNDNKEQVLAVFSILADEKNYPLIFHCNIGTDRTGMLGFLVNALLGVPEGELINDYLFSNLADIGGTRKASQLKNSGYYKAVMAASGETLSEKTYNCLLDFGVPKEQLDSVITILS